MEYVTVYHRRYDDHFEVTLVDDEKTVKIDTDMWDKFLREYGSNPVPPGQKKLSGLESVNQQALYKLLANKL